MDRGGQELGARGRRGAESLPAGPGGDKASVELAVSRAVQSADSPCGTAGVPDEARPGGTAAAQAADRDQVPPDPSVGGGDGGVRRSPADRRRGQRARHLRQGCGRGHLRLRGRRAAHDQHHLRPGARRRLRREPPSYRQGAHSGNGRGHRGRGIWSVSGRGFRRRGSRASRRQGGRTATAAGARIDVGGARRPGLYGCRYVGVRPRAPAQSNLLSRVSHKGARGSHPNISEEQSGAGVAVSVVAGGRGSCGDRLLRCQYGVVADAGGSAGQGPSGRIGRRPEGSRGCR